MLIYLDQIGDKKLKAPSTDDASKALTGHVYSSSTASIRTAGGLSVEKRISVGQLDGRVPLGGVIPVIGTYSSPDNLGSFTTASGIPSSGSISDDGFMRCDGAIIPSGQEAKLSGYVPNITDDRYLQGSVSAGVASVINLGNVNQGNNSVKLITANLPPHSHNVVDPGHTHSGAIDGFYLRNVAPFGALGIPPSNLDITVSSISVGNAFTGISIGNTGFGTSFDIRPKYITAIYLIRVR